jgi:hypothetical protein
MYEGPIRKVQFPGKGVEGYENVVEVPLTVRWDENGRPYYFCDINMEEYTPNQEGDKLILKDRSKVKKIIKIGPIIIKPEGVIAPTPPQAIPELPHLTDNETYYYLPVEQWYNTKTKEQWDEWERWELEKYASQRWNITHYERTWKYRICLFVMKLFKIKRTKKQ